MATQLIELKFEVLVYEEGGKPEIPEKNPWEQGQEPAINSSHIDEHVHAYDTMCDN